jgi:hypothetical protein
VRLFDTGAQNGKKDFKDMTRTRGLQTGSSPFWERKKDKKDEKKARAADKKALKKELAREKKAAEKAEGKSSFFW